MSESFAEQEFYFLGVKYMPFRFSEWLIYVHLALDDFLRLISTIGFLSSIKVS